MTIYATQFHLPDGRRSTIGIDRPEAIEKLAEELVSVGYRFEAEVLTTGLVHIDVCDDEDVLAMFVSNNDSSVLVEFDALVQRAHAALKEKP